MRSVTDLLPLHVVADTKTVEVNGHAYPGMIEVRVDKAADLDKALNKAIDVVFSDAKEHRTGILVTRISAGRYIVRAHPAVPFGLVRQRHA